MPLAAEPATTAQSDARNEDPIACLDATDAGTDFLDRSYRFVAEDPASGYCRHPS